MITKLKENKLIIELDLKNVDESFLSYLSSFEISQQSKATEKDIKALADEITGNWWKRNKKKFNEVFKVFF